MLGDLDTGRMFPSEIRSMNVERFHALALALKSDLEETELPQRLRDVQNALQQLIHEPHASHQEGVGHSLDALRGALEQSVVERFSPAWKRLLEGIGFHEKLGAPLRSSIDELFQRTQLTPALAKQEIDKRVYETGRLQEILDHIASGFPELNIGSEELEGEDCEIGFLIPEAAIDHRLDRFADELKEFNSIFRTFAEVATEKPADFEIRTVSSGDFVVYLKAEAAVASFTAAALDRIITVYRQLIEIRKLRTELSEQDVPKEALEKLDQHSNTKMANAIDEIAVSLVLEYYPSENGRRAGELANLLRVCLSKLANRIDRGYNIEVRAAAPADYSEEQEDAKKSVEQDQETYHLETIRSLVPRLEFMRLEGDSILNLSEKAPRKALPWKKGPARTTPVKAAPRKPSSKKKTATKKAAPKKTAPKKAVSKKKAPSRKPAAKKAVVPKAAPGKKVEPGSVSPKIADLAAAAAGKVVPGVVAVMETPATDGALPKRKPVRRKKGRSRKRRAAARKAAAAK